jgi:hypothetical protein
MRQMWHSIVIALGICGCVYTAFGDTITIYKTGESTTGTALPIGTTDPNFSLISAPAGVPLTAITSSPDSFWIGNTTTADWISPSSNGSTSWPVGTYDYQTSFNLTGLDPATAQLSGQWTSDNNACIDLNGVNTGSCSPFGGFDSLLSFSITTGFQSGVNTLDFVVTNGGGPTGLFAEISGMATVLGSTVPEPSFRWPLLGMSLLAAGLFRRRTLIARNPPTPE